jgi:hypothetical protein
MTRLTLIAVFLIAAVIAFPIGATIGYLTAPSHAPESNNPRPVTVVTVRV